MSKVILTKNLKARLLKAIQKGELDFEDFPELRYNSGIPTTINIIRDDGRNPKK